MRKLLLFLALFAGTCFAQGVRFDSVASTTKIMNGQVVSAPIPNAIITVCTGTATLSSNICTPTVQTFTDATLGTACGGTTQVTLTGSNVCQATGDTQGNFGFWLPIGNYKYTVSGLGVTNQTYSITLTNGINTQYAAGTGADCGIGAAYAAGPTNGTKVILLNDCTIATAQTFNLSSQKSLFLDLGGHRITCTNPTGTVCMTFQKPDALPRYFFEIANGTIFYGGTGTGVTGIQVGVAACCMTNYYVFGLVIDSFSTAGSIGMSAINAQDGHYDSISYNNNNTALFLGLNTIQNQFSNVWFQNGVNAISATDAYEMTFLDCLIQSNTGTKVVQIASSTQALTEIRFKHCHFENNGDTTVNSRQVSFQPASGKNIVWITFEDNQFNAGANAVNSTIYEALGPGNVQFVNFKNNKYFTTTALSTGAGFVGQAGYVVQNENMNIGDVLINPGNLTGQLANCLQAQSGLVFSPQGTTHTYQLLDDTSAFLKFYDCTGNTEMLRYNSSTWTFSKQISIPANPIIFGETTAPTQGAAQDWVYGDSASHTLKAAYNNGSFFSLTQTIASGTAAMTTAAIAAGACGTTVTVAAAGVATTDTITWAFNAAPGGQNAGLVAWPTSGNVNFAYCSNTAETPAAATINWRVVR